MEAAVLSKPHRLKYHFFLSFRGEDTRHTLVKRLYEDLHEKEIVLIFRDNEGMERGQPINPSLVAGIEDSAASLVVFSSRYADSHWCLDELAKLCDLSSSLDRPMIPIFYEVDPCDVRKQSGRFVKDFEAHAQDIRFSKEEIQRWRGAMKIVGNIPGYIYRKGENEDEMMISEQKNKIKKIKEDEIMRFVVKRVLAEVNNTPEKVGEYTVGLESRVDDLMNLVNLKSSSQVQILGLYGTGGIGKTTLAKRFYNKIVEYFKEQRVFISNVRERSSGHDGLLNLQKTLIKGILRLVPEVEDVNKGRDKIRESVYEKKILVVLDDVDKVDQVDALLGERSWYGEGTLIVITTRDEEILNRLSVSLKYEVKCLSEEEAVKLFSYHSLRKEKPTGSLLKLSENIVKITGLLPLAVEVFGSLFYDKKEKEWLVQLKKLEETKPNGLQDVLKLSFESLDDEEKKVFLDTACLFLKMDMTKEEIVDVLKGCGFNAEAALKALRQKSLVKFLADDTLWMHDQIKDMGMQMVIQESLEDPGKRSRLWDHGEIMTVLNNAKGTPSIRGIVLDFKKKFVNPGISIYLKNILKPTSSENTIPVEHFVPMKKLRLLQINHVELQGNLEQLPPDLKWIQWRGCLLKDVPPSFLNRQLAVLDLSESGIRRFQSLQPRRVDDKLKVLNLRDCHSLEAFPDLSNHEALEKLDFQGCKLLVKVPASVGNMKTLLHLDFRNCTRLTEFLEDVSGLKFLEKLYLSGCSNLSVLPEENFGAMKCLKELLLDGTAIKKLPESIFRLEKLQKLNLKSCRSIQELPLCIGTLTSLEELDLSSTSLQSLPSSIGSLISLQKLYVMHCTSLTEIPDTINNLASLQELVIDESAVGELPLSPGSLPCLTKLSAGGCRSLKQVPSSIGRLNSLLQLKLDSTQIETLPEEISELRFIQKLELRNCISLKSLPSTIGEMDTLHSLYLEGSNIEQLPEEFGKLESLVLLQMNKCKNLKKLPNSFGGLKSLQHLHMEETLVMELPESFGDLSNLKVLKMMKIDAPPGTGEESSFVIPKSFSNLLLLEELDARGCGISGEVPDVFEKLSSVKILNLGNNKFHSFTSSLKGLSDLEELSLHDCRELTCVPPLPCKLKQLNLGNCFSLESISDLSELTMLRDLNLTNCEKVDDIPGLEHLTALKRLDMSGCNFQVHL
ncbi:Disease resistance protein (TIR-NBS-LRR class) family [Raphanus sativus]|uniref:Disease resistance protein RPV1 n=1 Tax=Raphanus sativus TaxID=3726 RepID=A0A9W3DRY1_RAPSA|nr:disease resistance protein RPV1 [Raphanus sativus]KAJ4916538.1 Disease resistance protein (TIR-NBS-LRR class) family [Raphanus sativus]